VPGEGRRRGARADRVDVAAAVRERLGLLGPHARAGRAAPGGRKKSLSGRKPRRDAGDIASYPIALPARATSGNTTPAHASFDTNSAGASRLAAVHKRQPFMRLKHHDWLNALGSLDIALDRGWVEMRRRIDVRACEQRVDWQLCHRALMITGSWPSPALPSHARRHSLYRRVAHSRSPVGSSADLPCCKSALYDACGSRALSGVVGRSNVSTPRVDVATFPTVLDVQRVDFVSVPTRDLARSRHFYADVLGLPPSTLNPDEFETANVTLSLWQPEAEGVPFTPNTAGIALRVADVESARERLSACGVELIGDTVDTGVCLMASFTTRMATS
jgi:predicted enzyme related to lactoylglutathione lyase